MDLGDSTGSAPPQSDVAADRILIVEGGFDLGFLRALLQRNSRAKVQVESIDGKDNFSNRALARLLSDDKDELRWVGLARDADTSPAAALQSLQDVLRRFARLRPESGFVVPREPSQRTAGDSGRTATLFVFPGDGANGDIETWIWGALKHSDIASCVEKYVECLAGINHQLRRESKTRVYAYLAALASPDMPLGIAARAASIPIDSGYYDAFLDQIPNDNEIL